MKKAMIYLLLLVLSLGIAGCGGKESGENSPHGLDKIPAFACQDINGTDVTNDIFSGSKLTLVNVWTTG